MKIKEGNYSFETARGDCDCCLENKTVLKFAETSFSAVCVCLDCLWNILKEFDKNGDKCE